MITPARLREIADNNDKAYWPDGVHDAIDELREAADEIERLQSVIDVVRPEAGYGRVFDDYVATVPIVTEFWKRGTLEARVQALRDDRDRLKSELDAANRRFAEMSTPTGREIELQAIVGQLPKYRDGKLYQSYNPAPGTMGFALWRYSDDDELRVSECWTPDDPDEAATGHAWIIDDCEDLCEVLGVYSTRESAEKARQSNG